LEKGAGNGGRSGWLAEAGGWPKRVAKKLRFYHGYEERGLQHPSTGGGEAFMAFIRLILKQVGLIRLLWGKVFKSESKVILLLGKCYG
jgi:hypothetical protein